MARPLSTAKQSVNLAPNPASTGPRVSRIRRDPPPAVKQTLIAPDESDQRAVVVGVLTFALSIFVIIIALGSYTSRSPSEYTVEVNVSD